MGDITWSKVYFLSLLTLSYIVGELTHFMINTTSREVAREVEFGEKSCFLNESIVSVNDDKEDEVFDCKEAKNERACKSDNNCYWDYSGLGIEYQVRIFKMISSIIFWFLSSGSCWSCLYSYLHILCCLPSCLV